MLSIANACNFYRLSLPLSLAAGSSYGTTTREASVDSVECRRFESIRYPSTRFGMMCGPVSSVWIVLDTTFLVTSQVRRLRHLKIFKYKYQGSVVLLVERNLTPCLMFF